MNLQILKAPIANAAMLIRRPGTEVFNAYINPHVSPLFCFFIRWRLYEFVAGYDVDPAW